MEIDLVFEGCVDTDAVRVRVVRDSDCCFLESIDQDLLSSIEEAYTRLRSSVQNGGSGR